jgi:sigma-B regulation protein RsbU (phosphoserine phosphatase)
VAEASSLLNATLDPKAIGERIVDLSVRLAHADRGSLFLLDSGAAMVRPLVVQGADPALLHIPVGTGIVGLVAATGRTVIQNRAEADPRHARALETTLGYRVRSVLTVPVRDRAGALVAVLQLYNHRRGGFTREDADFLKEMGAPFAVALSTARLHEELLGREKLERDVKLAAEIQRTMLPQEFSGVGGLEIRTLFRPSLNIAGDYFDAIPTGWGTHWLALADVSGKGVSASLVAGQIQAFLWSRRRGTASLREVAAELSELILSLARGRKYATMVLAEWSPEDRALSWVGAGHPPLLLKRRGCVEALRSTGLPVGLLPGRSYDLDSTVLEAGDMMVLVTDGILEAGAEGPSGEFGQERLSALLASSESVEDLIRRTRNALEDHLGGAPPGDDLTLLCARCLP